MQSTPLGNYSKNKNPQNSREKGLMNGANHNLPPLVSFVMPVYNAEKYIGKAIDSALGQTYQNFELIIVNDASADRSKEIILSYSDPRIRYLENPVNMGIVKTRNKCIAHSSGKYIAVLDNDDVSLPLRLEKQVEFLEANGSYGMCGSYWEIIDGAGEFVANVEVPITNLHIKTYLIFNNCFCASTVMMRSEILKEFMYREGFDMIEDFNLYHSFYRKTKFSNLPIYTTQYRAHGNNRSMEKLDELLLLRKKMDAKILNNFFIPFTERELMLHTSFVNGKYHLFKDKDQLNQLETWLLKVYDLLKNNHDVDTQIILGIFIKRWFYLFYKNRKLSFRILNTPLFWNFKRLYAKYFVEFMMERFSKRIILS